jgi:hypothetical protein
MLFSFLTSVDPSYETDSSGFGFTVPLGMYDDGSGEVKFHYITFPVDGSSEPSGFSTTYPYFQSMAIKRAMSSGDPSGFLG